VAKTGIEPAPLAVGLACIFASRNPDCAALRNTVTCETVRSLPLFFTANLTTLFISAVKPFKATKFPNFVIIYFYCFYHNTISFASKAGLEPATYGFGIRCSTN
jgi:hypothetical protein